MSAAIRPFERRDGDQLTALANSHVSAVIPGIVLSVNTVLGQLELEPYESIVDPWVAERLRLVAEQDNEIVAATLLHRFRPDDDVSAAYRGAGGIRWLVCEVDAGEAGAQGTGHRAATEPMSVQRLATGREHQLGSSWRPEAGVRVPWRARHPASNQSPRRPSPPARSASALHSFSRRRGAWVHRGQRAAGARLPRASKSSEAVPSAMVRSSRDFPTSLAPNRMVRSPIGEEAFPRS